MLLENELDYFALIHYDVNGQTGTFTMLSPMLEFARTKYRDSEQHEWEVLWLNFWRQCVKIWDQLLSGRLPDTMGIAEDKRRTFGTYVQQAATELFAYTQPNWLAAFEFLVQTDSVSAISLLLNVTTFCQLTGQHTLLKNLCQQPLGALRGTNAEKALASCLGTLGISLSHLGEREAARAAYTEALEIYRRLAPQHPAAFEPDVAGTLNNLGNVLKDLGEREAARTAFTEALEIRRRPSPAAPSRL